LPVLNSVAKKNISKWKKYWRVIGLPHPLLPYAYAPIYVIILNIMFRVSVTIVLATLKPNMAAELCGVVFLERYDRVRCTAFTGLFW
jgi:hypothetical protein